METQKKSKSRNAFLSHSLLARIYLSISLSTTPVTFDNIKIKLTLGIDV